MLKCLDFFPVGITHFLTDNGHEFTNRLIKSKKGSYCQKPSKFDDVCIRYRHTKTFTLNINGMEEKANDIIKSGTIKINQYNDAGQMNDDLLRFLIHYNL